MSGCEECRQESIDPLVGREPWRQARLTDATGPTGPTGVVHDMRSATGPFAAVVESGLCECSMPGTVAISTFGFTAASTNFISNAKSFPYRDGVVTLTTLAAGDLSAGVWMKAEVVPSLALPEDTVTRGPLPFVLTSGVANATPTLSESSEYIYAEHGMWFTEDSLNYISATMVERNDPEYYSGPIRITAGYGEKTRQAVYSLHPGVWVPSVRVRETTVTLALSPYDVSPPVSPRRISAIAALGDLRGTFSFPIEVPENFVLGGGAEHQSTANLYNGIALDYDVSRMSGQTLVNPELLRGPTISVAQRPILEDGKTDVIVPPSATGPTGQLLPVTEAGVHIGNFILQTAANEYISQNANEYQNPLNYRFFSRGFANARLGTRPDLHAFPACYALNGPTWHERNIIRYGSALGVDGARHKWTVKFDWESPSSDDYVSYFNTLWLVPPIWQVTANITFLMLGGSELELLPDVQGRKVMPGFYAVGATEMDAVDISQISGTVSAIPGEPSVESTASVAMTIQPIVHAWAVSTVTEKVPASNAPKAYTTLPLPGEQGMTLDAYTIWSPTTEPGFGAIYPAWPTARPIAEGRISLRLQAWFKITMTSVGLNPAWSGNRVVYRRLATPEIVFNLSDEQCNALSDGDEISVSSTGGDPYKIQFSIYEP